MNKFIEWIIGKRKQLKDDVLDGYHNTMVDVHRGFEKTK